MSSKNVDIPIHLERIINRSILDLYFKVIGPISVGMDNEGNIRKIVVTPTKNGYIPFIPAESIKGVMRNITRKIYDNSCNKGEHNKDMINQIDENKIKEELSKIFTVKQLDKLNKDDKLNLYLALRCPICKLFGSHMLCGKLLFSDMFPSNDAKIFTYTGISINRKKRTVEEDRLFTTEYIMSSYTQMKIIANNIIDRQEHELLITLLTIISDKGIQIGGLRSKGYGLLMLDKDRSKITVLEFISPKDEDGVIGNLKTLLKKDNYYKEFTVDEYVKEYVKRGT
ncbi:MAG: RAMP superfamily CRISPR-associated protein [Candidatus Nitrosocaldaceae archaeon]